MSEMPHCVAARNRCKMLINSYFGSLRIREFNRNLRNSPAIILESNRDDSGLSWETTAASAKGTAMNVQRIAAGCTIGVDKCIQ
jgi:hypothetical protein